jgi:hypothetical protein
VRSFINVELQGLTNWGRIDRPKHRTHFEPPMLSFDPLQQSRS